MGMGMLKKKQSEPEFLKDIDLGRHHAPEELALWLANGIAIKNLDELKSGLAKLNTREFALHVTPTRNEIADWVRDVLSNKKLGAELKIAHTQKAMLTALGAAPTVPTPESDPLQTEQDALAREEEQLSREEEALTQKRVELASRRYELVKQRGQLEQKLFEKFVSEAKETKGKPIPAAPTSTKLAHSKAQVIELINEARQLAAQRNTQEARKKLDEAQSAFRIGLFTTDERRKLEYSIIEIETDIRLASL